MTGIIVTGHGHFPTGILSAVSMVAGKPENTIGVDFEEGKSSQELRRAMDEAVKSLEGDEILILADLAGGTPFNIAAALKAETEGKNIKVIAGVNMAGLVEAVFSRPMYGLEELAASVETAAKEGVAALSSLGAGEEEPEFEDGL